MRGVVESERESAVELAWLRDLALRAGDHLRREDERRDDLQVRHKGDVALVTRVDDELQGLLVSALRARHPGELAHARPGAGPVQRRAERNRGGGVAVAILQSLRRKSMNGIIYLIGLVVVVIAILSFFGLG